jgi:hypothetical protein
LPDERILNAGMAAVDFEAATVLEAGVLPCSSGEDQVLRLAPSIAAGVLVDRREVLTGLDEASSGLPAGRRPPCGHNRCAPTMTTRRWPGTSPPPARERACITAPAPAVWTCSTYSPLRCGKGHSHSSWAPLTPAGQ